MNGNNKTPLKLPYRDITIGKNLLVTIKFRIYDLIYNYLKKILHIDVFSPNTKLALCERFMINC